MRFGEGSAAQYTTNLPSPTHKHMTSPPVADEAAAFAYTQSGQGFRHEDRRGASPPPPKTRPSFALGFFSFTVLLASAWLPRKSRGAACSRPLVSTHAPTPSRITSSPPRTPSLIAPPMGYYPVTPFSPRPPSDPPPPITPPWEGPPPQPPPGEPPPNDLTPELDAAPGSPEVDFGPGDLKYGPSTSPATPSPPDPASPGSRSSTPPPLGVESICDTDEERVKRPLGMHEANWPHRNFNFGTGRANQSTLNEFFASRVGRFQAARCRMSAPPKKIEPTPDSVARHLGLTRAEFDYAVRGDYRHLARWAATPIQEDSGEFAEPADEPPGVHARFDRLPEVQEPEDRDPIVPSTGKPTDDLPERYASTFSFYEMFKDPDRARRLIEAWETQTKADAVACYRAVRAGRRPTVPKRDALVFSATDFVDCLVGRHIDTEDWQECFVVSCADEVPSHTRPDGSPVPSINHANLKADLGPKSAWADQELPQAMAIGTDSKSSQPWGLVLCGMNKSAAADLSVVAKAIDAGIEAGWQTDSSCIAMVPAVFEPFGIAWKKHSLDPVTGLQKPRLTSELRGDNTARHLPFDVPPPTPL